VIDPIDKYAKNIILPRDYANHIVYGGVLGLVLLPFLGSLYALITVFIISVAKKVFDYVEEHESLKMCVIKSFVTAFYPFAIYLIIKFHIGF